jgi:hypothetical protein
MDIKWTAASAVVLYFCEFWMGEGEERHEEKG